MKSTVGDERLSTTTTRVLFKKKIDLLLNDTTEWEIYTKIPCHCFVAVVDVVHPFVCCFCDHCMMQYSLECILSFS